MYKLFISYDISKVLIEAKNLNASNEYENIKNILKAQLICIHLQESSWIVYTNDTDSEMYIKLKATINTQTKSKVAVVDITKEQVYANDYIKIEHKDTTLKDVTIGEFLSAKY